MRKQTESEFVTKFNLLISQNTQDNDRSEEIIWSSSDSSDYEHYESEFERKYSRSECRKRKRIKRQGTTYNIPCLDITCREDVNTNLKQIEKSPILKTQPKTCVSPILNCSLRLRDTTKSIPSPIIPIQSNSHIDNIKTSPILLLKNTPPKYLSPVRKKLFRCDNGHITKEMKNDTIHDNVKIDEVNSQKYIIDITTNRTSRDILNLDDNIELSQRNNNVKISFHNKKSSNSELINKVKSYFKENVSSESSQHSNIEFDSTPSNSTKSEEIIISQIQEKSDVNLQENSITTDYMNFLEKSGKIKYKKDGLAYRLSSILKKQNANTSLWQHERYLAAHSNFIIPKGESIAFRIQNVKFKYGVYVLVCKGVNNDKVLICMNSHDCSTVFKKDYVIRLYTPYTVINCTNHKLIVHAPKFECKKL